MKFLYGSENYLIEQETKKIVSDIGLEPIIYSEDDPIDEIIMDISTIALFEENQKKLFLLKNNYFLTKNDDAQKMVDIISKLDSSVKIIFSLETKTLSKSNPLIKFLLKNSDSMHFQKLRDNQTIALIKTMVSKQGGTISNSASIKLFQKLPNNLQIMSNEINKLLHENLQITDSMVDNSIGFYVRDDYFSLSNAIVENNSHTILKAYQERIASGDEPLLIIAQIVSILSLAAIINAYKEQSWSNATIAEHLKIHPFRITKASELISLTSPAKLESLILKLAKLDQDIKTGKVNEQKGIDLFILKLVN